MVRAGGILMVLDRVLLLIFALEILARIVRP